jgi:protein-L-isoaspartate(D-aspartate) O-methyltransferase
MQASPNRPLRFGLLLCLLVLTACSPATSPAAGAPSPTVKATPSPPAGATSPTVGAAPSPSGDLTVVLRQEMVKVQLQGRDITDERVLAAMGRVPRHEFVPVEFLDQAYDDHPLPIGYGQTISQPYIVALMTQLVNPQPGKKVLEIGTGSGYQAAVLAELTDQVYTIEIIPELAGRAEATLKRLGYDKIVAKQADGYWGWAEHAPFDAILVTAAPDHVPQPLVNQLAEGGIMVIPVGPPGGYQSLWILERHGEEIIRTNWGAVSFVPLTRAPARP